jgi:regulator of protease activity HflC (stomatin/prohibitin superfamily)
MTASYGPLAMAGGGKRSGGQPMAIVDRRSGSVLAAGAVVALAGLAFFSATRNPVTPAGYVGYLTRGAVFGRTRFVGVQTGPTSPGRGWLLHVTNVSVNPHTDHEEFRDDPVLSADSLKIFLRVHTVWRIRPDRVQELVEKYSTLGPSTTPENISLVSYQNFLRSPLRNYARDEVQKYDGLDIKSNIGRIDEALTARLQALTRDTPFEVTSVVLGDIEYPSEMVDAVTKKLAAIQELESKNTEIEIARREKQKRIIEAEGIARATQIISERLTGPYLQYEAIKTQRETVSSPSHTTVYIPVGAMGVPLVGNLNAGGAPR